MKKMKKKIKIKYFNIFIIISMILASILLIHDLFIFAIIPFFTGKFYMVTYLGMFIDLSALIILEVSLQIIKDWK